ncbi:TIGR03619 family F420-dependent LLM class oxidoreductase [Actinoallomurus acaciae]|uniref:TIGR03619 family F420-dependent LLM class oxidoreductase n=1 Tax=Actinoallomurus acaciae TaxID=502577 RepID=A0ABV5YE02_9ACTN
MRVGLALSQYGAFARRDAVIEVARAAEALGFDSLWTGDRILDPVNPRDRYPGSADGRMPPEYTTFLDPLTVLTAAAAVTERVRLGTSTLNAPWYSPVLLARTLTSLDVLSEGRLDVGLGLGWSSDEYAAAGVPWARRGVRLEEIVDVLERIWADDPVTYESGSFSVPTSRIEPKPVQRPRPPIYLGGYSSVTLERIGRRADGWLAAGVPLAVLTPMWDAVRHAAEDAGRDPDSLRMMLRMNPRITDEPAAADLLPRTGTIEQIAEYARSTGAYEVFADFQQTTGDLKQMLDLAGRFRAAMA